MYNTGIGRGQKEFEVRSPFVKRLDLILGNIGAGTTPIYRSGCFPILGSSAKGGLIAYSPDTPGRVILVGVGMQATAVSAGNVKLDLNLAGSPTDGCDAYGGSTFVFSSTAPGASLRPTLTPTSLVSYTEVYNKIPIGTKTSAGDVNALIGPVSPNTACGHFVFALTRSESLSIDNLRVFIRFIPIIGYKTARLKEY